MTCSKERELFERLERMERMLSALIALDADRKVGIAMASEILGCTKQALYKRIARGQVNCEISGNGRYVFDKKELIALATGKR